MRISDWSSDVCSSDLGVRPAPARNHPFETVRPCPVSRRQLDPAPAKDVAMLGRKSPRQPASVATSFQSGSREEISWANVHRSFTSTTSFPCPPMVLPEIGRASCRERVCQYVSISVVAVSLKKKREYM